MNNPTKTKDTVYAIVDAALEQDVPPEVITRMIKNMINDLEVKTRRLNRQGQHNGIS